jgi:hypothetical protein
MTIQYKQKPPMALPELEHCFLAQIWDVYFDLFCKTNARSSANTHKKIEEAEKVIVALKKMNLFHEEHMKEIIDSLETKMRWWRGELIYRYKEQITSSELNALYYGKIDEYGEWVHDLDAWAADVKRSLEKEEDRKKTT